LETWSDGKAPPYGVQASPPKPGVVDLAGIAWGSYGGTAAIRHLEALITDLTTGSSVEYGIREELDAWICGPIPDAVLAATDADDVLEELRSFREWYCPPS